MLGRGLPQRTVMGSVPTKEPAHRFCPKSRVADPVLGRKLTTPACSVPKSLPCQSGERWHPARGGGPRGPRGRGRFPTLSSTQISSPKRQTLRSDSWTASSCPFITLDSGLAQSVPELDFTLQVKPQGSAPRPPARRAPLRPRERARGLRGYAPPGMSRHGRGDRHPTQNSTREPGDRGGEVNSEKQEPCAAAAAAAAAKRFQIFARRRRRRRRPGVWGRGFPRSHSPPPAPLLRPRPARRAVAMTTVGATAVAAPKSEAGTSVIAFPRRSSSGACATLLPWRR